jgi:hypothetical protein
MALWLAFFNQATCSTSIINFAPKILERAGIDDRDNAVLFASVWTTAAAATAATWSRSAPPLRVPAPHPPPPPLLSAVRVYIT